MARNETTLNPDGGTTPSYDARSFGVNVGVFRNDPWPASGIYRLYHGTTTQSAKSIEIGGIQAPDFGALIREVATEADVAVSELRDHLWGFTRARDLIDDLDTNVYFTGSPLRAASYASRGSEVVYEAWKAIYWVSSPDASHKEAGDWAIEKSAPSPAVMAYDIPYESLMKADNRDIEPDPVFWDINTVSLPAAASSANLVSWHVVEPVWRWDAVRAKLKHRQYSVDPLLESGDLPEPDHRFFGDIWWWESTIRPYLVA